MVNIFEMFLPQLLTYPNPSDPLNPKAASLMNQNLKLYEETVRTFVKNFAQNVEKVEEDNSSNDADNESNDSFSSNDSFDPF